MNFMVLAADLVVSEHFHTGNAIDASNKLILK
jgi:hypothetical protein